MGSEKLTYGIVLWYVQKKNTCITCTYIHAPDKMFKLKGRKLETIIKWDAIIKS